MKKKPKTKLWEWQERCKSGIEKCSYPNCNETRDLTVDHIVPVNILEQFGLDRLTVLYEMEENFKILCRYHNYRKSGQLDVKDPQTYEVLTKVANDAKRYYLPNCG